MSAQVQAPLAQQVAEAAQAAGLQVVSTATGTDFHGAPTTVFTLGLDGKNITLELSADLDVQDEKLKAPLVTYLTEAASRLKGASPDMLLTLQGLPLRFEKFAWPFHVSTSGADTHIVHGETRLLDGKDDSLHAKVSASTTLTFMEALPAMQQPYAESTIYNAVRKTMDQGQLELVKSGNRQPVPVTTRYWSPKSRRFVFNDTTEQQRQDYLAAKAFWLSGVLGSGERVWVMDPRDAQYLNTDVNELKRAAQALAREGLLLLDDEEGYARPTEALMGLRPQYEAQLAKALEFTKPKFNEDMRAGHTNM